jgi:hypothetical protein
MLMIYMNPVTWESLSEDQRNEVFGGHDDFTKVARESGEFIGTHTLADPSNSAVVRVRDGAPSVTDGPFVEAEEHLAGFYLVDCETKERAIELAGLVPDARFSAMEVRPVMFSAGAEM